MLDLNQRNVSMIDLQSIAFNRSANDPMTISTYPN